ncbi:LysR substrate-binding domain-containing protein [Sphingomonas ginsenosidivorax]|uniref:LysR substrate-binding domain-containing protein n=1 Tax=Sphingomonas ginsenosidivorax TaxID=862135 RepID=UPI0030D32E3C
MWRVVRVRLTAPYRSNDITALVEAARQGIGIVAFGEWSMARDFAEGTLTPLLPEWSFETDGGIHLLRPSVRLMPARTEAFVRWIVQLFEEAPPWHRAPVTRALAD